MSKYPTTATYWSPGAFNEYAQRTYSAPVTISVRWETKTEVFLESKTGKEVRSHSIVYTTSDVDPDGFLYLGTSVASDPLTVDGAYRIKRFDKTPALRGSKTTRKAWL